MGAEQISAWGGESRRFVCHHASRLVIGITLAALVQSWAVASFVVPSGSMEGTLLVGDFVLVSKVHYGVRVPVLLHAERGGWRLPGFRGVRKGDIVVFDGVGENAQGRRLVKRVIGAPGDVVRFVGSDIKVNGIPAELRGEMKRAWVARTQPGGKLDRTALYRLGITEVEAHADDSATYTLKHASARVAAGVAV